MSTPKKNSKRIGTTSSRTRFDVPLTAGPGEILQLLLQEFPEVCIDALPVIEKMSRTKKRKQTILPPSLSLCMDFKDGRSMHIDCLQECLGSKSCALRATASKPKPRMSSEKESERSRDREEWRKLAALEAQEAFSKERSPRLSQLAKGLKHDSEKPALAYIPKAALYAEGQAFAYGAKKYESWNYKNGLAVTRTLSASIRHIIQFLDGEDVDGESGTHHLGCARANLAMALDTLTHHPEMDDRFKGGKK